MLLLDRPPTTFAYPFGQFDDVAVRRELWRRLNEIAGIELAEAKLELRPSFPLQVFAEHTEEICAVLEWFVHTAALDLAQRA